MIEVKDGAAFRDGEKIGIVEGDKLIVPEKLHHATVKKIESETGLTITLADAEGNESDMGNPISGQDDALPPLPLDPEPVLKDESIAEMLNPPPQDHRGDKTPAYIDWLFRNRPEEANRRYANRKISR